MSAENEKLPKEFVVETGIYRGQAISVTNFGNYIVVIYEVPYPAQSLDASKTMIDDLCTSRAN